MADYIYTMEIRLTPDQQRGVTLVQDIARAAGMNVYLTGGAVRDIISGFSIRDLDFTVQGNPLKLQKELERAGATMSGVDDDLKTLYLVLPGNVRAEISSARTERYEKTGKPPVISPATIIEDLRRRDFTVNAMALSLNPGSRGLLMDPFNGAADIETKTLRILHNYAFVEDPSRLIRALRFAARFNWPLEERTQARFESAKENKYIEYITSKAIGREIEQLAYEDDPLNIIRALEKEQWLKVLNQHWTIAKVDTAGLSELLKTRQQMSELGYPTDPAAAVLYFLTAKLGDKDVSEIRRLIPRKDLVEAWRTIEDNAKALGKRLSGKEASTPSRTWKLLSETQPEMILFLAVTSRQKTVDQKIKNFFTKWREVQKKVPLLEMTELRITPQMVEYPKIANEVFMLLLDGKLRSHTEIMKFLKPLAPPPPPPPPPPPTKRGRGAKAAAAAAAQAGPATVTPLAGKGKKKGKAETTVVAPAAVAKEVSKPVASPLAKPAKPKKASVPKKATKPPKTKTKKSKPPKSKPQKSKKKSKRH
ncbi:MAG: CCA tRNA nucleotidyltransferase [Terriglobales bacterium]|jgi:tRNA nucleotidyltransferase/poly(A) polymerase|nr:CCA tRNA nucleotidyltransferase [Terriglobales bacterium]